MLPNLRTQREQKKPCRFEQKVITLLGRVRCSLLFDGMLLPANVELKAPDMIAVH